MNARYVDRPPDPRSRRAREEPMRVSAVGDGVYEVVTASDHTYTVDLREGNCTCPDHRFREARCKHLRRVAIEVTAGRLPAPGERATDCATCGATVHVDRESPDPAYCEACTLDPGEYVVDRETDSLVVVVETTDDRANEVAVQGRGWTVADHYSNRAYDARDVVVDVLYPLDRGVAGRDVSPRDLQRYSFPRGRLTRRRGGSGRPARTSTEQTSLADATLATPESGDTGRAEDDSAVDGEAGDSDDATDRD